MNSRFLISQEKPAEFVRTYAWFPHLWGEIPCTSHEQFGMCRVDRKTETPDFYLPFGGKLELANRSIKFVQIIPWDFIEEGYRANLATNGISPALGGDWSEPKKWRNFWPCGPTHVETTSGEKTFLTTTSSYTRNPLVTIAGGH